MAIRVKRKEIKALGQDTTPAGESAPLRSRHAHLYNSLVTGLTAKDEVLPRLKGLVMGHLGLPIAHDSDSDDSHTPTVLFGPPRIDTRRIRVNVLVKTPTNQDRDVIHKGTKLTSRTDKILPTIVTYSFVIETNPLRVSSYQPLTEVWPHWSPHYAREALEALEDAIVEEMRRPTSRRTHGRPRSRSRSRSRSPTRHSSRDRDEYDDHGASEGDRLALLASRSVEWDALPLASESSGKYYVLTPRYQGRLKNITYYHTLHETETLYDLHHEEAHLPDPPSSRVVGRLTDLGLEALPTPDRGYEDPKGVVLPTISPTINLSNAITGGEWTLEWGLCHDTGPFIGKVSYGSTLLFPRVGLSAITITPCSPLATNDSADELVSSWFHNVPYRDRIVEYPLPPTQPDETSSLPPEDGSVTYHHAEVMGEDGNVTIKRILRVIRVREPLPASGHIVRWGTTLLISYLVGDVPRANLNTQSTTSNIIPDLELVSTPVVEVTYCLHASGNVELRMRKVDEAATELISRPKVPWDEFTTTPTLPPVGARIASQWATPSHVWSSSWRIEFPHAPKRVDMGVTLALGPTQLNPDARGTLFALRPHRDDRGAYPIYWDLRDWALGAAGYPSWRLTVLEGTCKGNVKDYAPTNKSTKSKRQKSKEGTVHSSLQHITAAFPNPHYSYYPLRFVHRGPHELAERLQPHSSDSTATSARDEEDDETTPVSPLEGVRTPVILVTARQIHTLDSMVVSLERKTE